MADILGFTVLLLAGVFFAYIIYLTYDRFETVIKRLKRAVRHKSRGESSVTTRLRQESSSNSRPRT